MVVWQPNCGSGILWEQIWGTDVSLLRTNTSIQFFTKIFPDFYLYDLCYPISATWESAFKHCVRVWGSIVPEWTARMRGAGALHLQLWELEERETDNWGLTSYPCPCRHCMGGCCIRRATIWKHLRTIGKDPLFTKPILVCPKHSLHVICNTVVLYHLQSVHSCFTISFALLYIRRIRDDLSSMQH